jgi:hypothetical protein
VRTKNTDKLWQAGLKLSLFVTLISAIVDGAVMQHFFALWEDPPVWRLLFFLSFGLLMLGLARNSARLRSLLEG